MKKFAIALCALLSMLAAPSAWTTEPATYGEGTGRFVAAFPGTPTSAPFGHFSTNYTFTSDAMVVSVLVMQPPMALGAGDKALLLGETPATVAQGLGMTEPTIERIQAHGMQGWAFEGVNADGSRVLARGYVGDRVAFAMSVIIAPAADASAEGVAHAFFDSFQPAPAQPEAKP